MTHKPGENPVRGGGGGGVGSEDNLRRLLVATMAHRHKICKANNIAWH